MTDLLFFFATLIVLFLPGTVWLIIIRPGKLLDPLERIAEAAGASLAITGVAALFLSLGGIRLGAAGMIGVYLAIIMVAAAVVWLRKEKPAGWGGGWGWLALGAVLAVTAWRMFQARELVLPAWVDSVHHVLLVRKIYEYGGLPPDWLPYLNVPMYYHYGFHVLAAAFSFWSRMDPAQAVLLFGQVINAMVVFSVYRLAKALWGDPLRAGLAAALTAFGFHMPAYYLTWGRYPMLAGLIVLPLAMAAALEVRRSPGDRAAWARLALFTAGVCVCHFLMVGLLGLFFLVLLSIEVYRVLRARALRGLLWQPFAAAGLGALAAAPWLLWVWQNSHQMFAIEVPNPLDPANAAASAWEYIIYLTGPTRSHILLALAGIGLLAALLRRSTRLIAVWGLLIAILATPYGPRFDPFRPDHLAIVLFLPGSLLLANLIVWGGELLGGAIERIGRWLGRAVRSPHESLDAEGVGETPLEMPITPEALPPPDGGQPEEIPVSSAIAPAKNLLANRSGSVYFASQFCRILLPLLVGLGISYWGISETGDIVNPVTVLAQAADLPALEWVAKNTPADARFFINSTGWQTLYRGEDGGYWLLPEIGRYSLVPPAAYGYGYRDDILRRNDLAKRASEVKACDDSFWSLVRDDHLNYVYLRAGTGSLQPEGLEGCAGVEKVYQNEGVIIYQITQ